MNGRCSFLMAEGFSGSLKTLRRRQLIHLSFETCLVQMLNKVRKLYLRQSAVNHSALHLWCIVAALRAGRACKVTKKKAKSVHSPASL